MRKTICLMALFCVVLSWGSAAEEVLIDLKGNFLAYSYDHNQIYGEGVIFTFNSYTVSCQRLKIDLASRHFYAYGEVRLDSAGETVRGDELFFNPQEQRMQLVTYAEELLIRVLGAKEEESPSIPLRVLEDVSLAKIRQSFLYFTCDKIRITVDFEVLGEGVILYLEGFESVGFRNFKLSQGLKQRSSGFSLDKIWFTKSQGIIVRGSHLIRSGNNVNSLTQVNYEERSVLKNYSGPDRQLDLLNSTSIVLDEASNLSLAGNYNSSGLWNASLILNRSWNENVNTSFDFAYNKPINYRGEAWFGVMSTVNGGKYGNLSVSGRYETQNQFLGNLVYGNTFLNNFNFLLNTAYSRVKIAGSDQFSEILTGGLSLAYNSRVFNLSTDYYLNYDLFGSQMLSQPQLRFGLNPFSFYSGILMVSLTNIFIYNHLMLADSHDSNYSNNMIFSLSTQPIYVRRNVFFYFSVSAEQFLEKENRNFTSGGFVGNMTYEIVRGLFLEGFYSHQSRRRTRNWLIEGTTSQDLSALVRLNPSQRLNTWVSVSYDPKNREWRQSFADISFEIIKKWRFHSLFHYDFILGRLNNVDLYLVREAGRFQLRFVYRSLSKQFVIELIPR
ncbi:hypothetical protein ACFLT2_11090 [Acidobacteriota bacterium]